MKLKQILEEVLDKNDGCCMDDEDDRETMLSALLAALTSYTLSVVVYEYGGCIEAAEVYLSEKEAWDRVVSQMKEEGYIWDFNKKDWKDSQGRYLDGSTDGTVWRLFSAGNYLNAGREQSTCPKCGSNDLDYGESTVDEGVSYPYKCLNCGHEGKEWYDLVFSEIE